MKNHPRERGRHNEALRLWCFFGHLELQSFGDLVANGAQTGWTNEEQNAGCAGVVERRLPDTRMPHMIFHMMLRYIHTHIYIYIFFITFFRSPQLNPHALESRNRSPGASKSVGDELLAYEIRRVLMTQPLHRFVPLSIRPKSLLGDSASFNRNNFP